MYIIDNASVTFHGGYNKVAISIRLAWEMGKYCNIFFPPPLKSCTKGKRKPYIPAVRDEVH